MCNWLGNLCIQYQGYISQLEYLHKKFFNYYLHPQAKVQVPGRIVVG